MTCGLIFKQARGDGEKHKNTVTPRRYAIVAHKSRVYKAAAQKARAQSSDSKHKLIYLQASLELYRASRISRSDSSYMVVGNIVVLEKQKRK